MKYFLLILSVFLICACDDDSSKTQNCSDEVYRAINNSELCYAIGKKVGKEVSYYPVDGCMLKVSEHSKIYLSNTELPGIARADTLLQEIATDTKLEPCFAACEADPDYESTRRELRGCKWQCRYPKKKSKN